MAAGAIFVSYRRSDTEGQSGRLFKDLCDHFGRERVLIDVVGMDKGRDFRRTIERRLDHSSVLLAVIGKTWLTVQDGDGRRRLDDPLDLVRLETATALGKDIAVVPVLVSGASMPREPELPDALKNLAFRDGVELTHARWDADVRHLIEALEPLVGGKAGLLSGRIAPLRRWLLWGLPSAAALGAGVWLGPLAWTAWQEQRLSSLQLTQEAARQAAARQKSAQDKAAQDKIDADKALADKAAKDKAASGLPAQGRAASAPAARDPQPQDDEARQQAAKAKEASDRVQAKRDAEDKLRRDQQEAEKRRATAVRISTASRARLDDLLQKTQTEGFTLEVIIAVGHTDNTLAAETANQVSQQRAQSVKAYLVSRGVEATRVHTDSRSSASPVADNSTAEGRQKNSRVEVEVVGTRLSADRRREKVTFAADVWFE